MDYNLERFVAAQAQTYTGALGEIAAGRKVTHWMWFIFPQLAGLGHSAMAQRYAIASLDEARAYLDHPLLGQRYRDCVGALQRLPTSTPEDVFGGVDAMKLKSSLTLFARAAPADSLFVAALGKWFGGAEDHRTLALLGLSGTGAAMDER